MRSLISFLQMTSLLQSISMRWPTILKETSEAGKIIETSSGDFLSIDCLFGALRGSMPKFYFKLAVLNIVPFLAILGAILY